MAEASPQLINQRIRNRLIEYLEFVVEVEFAPPPYGLNELINDWEFYVSEPVTGQFFPLPVYTAEEVILLRNVGSAWQAFCSATPQIIEDEAAAQSLPEWKALVVAARDALQEFSKRGKLSEERELQ